MAFNRELSQFANYLELDAGANYIGIATNTNDANVGIGSATPESKIPLQVMLKFLEWLPQHLMVL